MKSSKEIISEILITNGFAIGWNGAVRLTKYIDNSCDIEILNLTDYNSTFFIKTSYVLTTPHGFRPLKILPIKFEFGDIIYFPDGTIQINKNNNYPIYIEKIKIEIDFVV